MIFLGIDISPAGTRALALELESATVLAESFYPHRWIEGLADGHREQNPLHWIEAVDHSIRACLAPLAEQRHRISSIGVSSCLQGTVMLDQENRIVRPAKMPGDSSAHRQAEEIARAFGGNPGLIELIGNPIAADSTAAHCLWLKRHEPYHFQRTTHILSLKDFINYWLTGNIVTDAGMASGTGLFDVRKRQWSEEICSFIDARLGSLLPPLGDSISSCGSLRKALADAWGLDPQLMISLGSGSPMLACLGAGCVAPGKVSLEMGGSGILSGVSSTPCVDLSGEVALLCDATGQWLASAATNNAASAPDMLRRHYGWSPEQFEEMLGSSDAGAEGLLFLPYVSGETTPHLPEATGVLHGVTPDNFTPANMARATMEGVALGLGYGLGRMRELGFDPPEVHHTGAISHSSVSRQLLADVFGIPVIALTSPQGPAFGAAIHAALVFFQLHGETLAVQDMAQYLIRCDETSRCLPDPQRHSLYQQMISRQQYLVDTLHPAGFL